MRFDFALENVGRGRFERLKALGQLKFPGPAEKYCRHTSLILLPDVPDIIIKMNVFKNNRLITISKVWIK